MYNSGEVSVIRELAKQYMEIAQSDKHILMRRRFRASNDLKLVRPPLIIEEIPWEQMNYAHELDCVCADPFLCRIERSFRRQLFREKYFACDNYIEPFWPVGRAYTVSSNGLQVEERTLALAHTDIRAHQYHDILEDESALEAFRIPVVTAYPEQDDENLSRMNELLGDIMPVRLRGASIYYAPWDDITMLRGVEPILIDIYDRPEYLHRIIGLFTQAKLSEMDQMEKLGLYDDDPNNIHCTPGYVTTPSGSRFTAPWFRTMAQTFSSISPAAHLEFDVAYSVPLAAKCACTYYGCCEPLHDRMDILYHYPNLRKVGCSPWADVDSMAEQLGGRYVLSRKPNPANVAISTDEELIRNEIAQTVKACIRNSTPCDITLKDITTVSSKPQNLFIWARAASSVLDEYYGRD